METKDHDGEARSKLDALKQALAEKARSSKRYRLEADFAMAFDQLKDGLRKMTMREVIDEFNRIYGHKLYPPRFRQLYQAEQERRSAGAAEACPSPGDRLKVESRAGSEDTDPA